MSTEVVTYFNVLPLELIVIIGKLFIYTKYVYLLSYLSNIKNNLYFRNICIEIYDYFRKFPLDIIITGRKIRWIEIYETMYSYKDDVQKLKNNDLFLIKMTRLRESSTFIFLLLYEYVNLKDKYSSVTNIRWISELQNVLLCHGKYITLSSTIVKCLCSDIIDEIIKGRMEYINKLKSNLKSLPKREFPYQYSPSFTDVSQSVDLYIDNENVVLSFPSNIYVTIEGIYDDLGFFDEIGSKLKKALINKGYV